MYWFFLRFSLENTNGDYVFQPISNPRCTLTGHLQNETLEELIIPGSLCVSSNDINHCKVSYYVTAIGSNSFSGAKKLKYVKFLNPTKFERIEESAFKDCTSLEVFNLTNAVKLNLIGDNAFSGCTS